MKRRPKLMPEFKARQGLVQPNQTERRWATPLRMARHVVEDTAKRVEASKALFPWRFFRGDCHCHTLHSDGIGTVRESAEMARAAGLDFLFVTDHWGVTQAPECRREGVWVGQEPGAQHHHLGILGLDHAFRPTADLAADMAAVRRLGGTVFIPHPAGWWPKVVYTQERREALWTLPAPFLTEVINGAANLVTAFDYTDEMAVALWDELLMSGRRIHAMGNSDAHSPHAIGIVWNGVLAPRGDQAAIRSALSAGHSFASEAPLLNLTAGRTRMGDRLSCGGRKEPLVATVADSRGLLRVRLVADGKVRRTWHLNGQPVCRKTIPIPAAWRRYARLEAISLDGRRGYSNPVYLDTERTRG